MLLSPQLARTGEWFLHSGIQEPNGGVARYLHVDRGNLPVSTEITGYAASFLAYVHSLSGDQRHLDGAVRAAHFLASAWDQKQFAMPFELNPPAYTYFFDCGIIVRGLLSVYRSTGTDAFLDVAAELGRAMLRDFASPGSVSRNGVCI